jgi:FKBP-type peptidyl-prolyl cis-trans isomerase 2
MGMDRRALLLLLLLLLAGCEKIVVDHGDSVLLTYTGAFQNGTIFDTNDRSLALQFPDKRFQPLAVTIGKGGVIPGFENALLGMQEGKTKTVNVKPQDGYGTYDASLVFTIQKTLVFERDITVRRTVEVSKAELLQRMQAASISAGEMFNTENFIYNVTSVKSGNVTLYIVNLTHNPVQLEGMPWESSIMSQTPATYVFRHNVVAEETYNTENGPYIAALNATHVTLQTIFRKGQQFVVSGTPGSVTRETDESVTVDFNHPLAGHELVFTITVDKIDKRK